MLNQPNNKIRLSVAIITFNEERKLAGTLRAVQDFADEIVIVDSFSEDGTVSIAQNFGANGQLKTLQIERIGSKNNNFY